MSTVSSTPPRPPVVRTLRRLGSFLGPYRRRFVYAGIALLVAAGCTLAVGQGLKLVVDRGFTAGNGAELDRALVRAARHHRGHGGGDLRALLQRVVDRRARHRRSAPARVRSPADAVAGILRGDAHRRGHFAPDQRYDDARERRSARAFRWRCATSCSVLGALVLLMLTSLKLTLLVLAGLPVVVAADHPLRPARSPPRRAQPGSRCRHRRLRRRGDPRNPHGAGLCARARGPARLRRARRGRVRRRRAPHPPACAADRRGDLPGLRRRRHHPVDRRPRRAGRTAVGGTARRRSCSTR